MLNQVFLIGRLVSEASIKTAKDGRKYVIFSLAVNRINDECDFFTCISFEPFHLKLFYLRHIDKGILLYVDGRININKKDKSFCVYIRDIKFFHRAEQEYLNSIDKIN